jgi:hypothetical protein
LRLGVPALWASPAYHQVRRFRIPLVALSGGVAIGFGRNGHNGMGMKAGIMAGVAFGAFVWLKDSSSESTRGGGLWDAKVGPVVPVGLSRDELVSRLGIRFEDAWDSSSSFDVAGIGPVTFVAKQGEVELHLEPGTTVTRKQLAHALGLSPADLI